MERRRNNLDLIAEKQRQLQQRRMAAAQSQRPSSFSEVQKQAKVILGKKNMIIKEENKTPVISKGRRRPTGLSFQKPQPTPQSKFVDTISSKYLEYHPPVLSEYVPPTDILFPTPPWFTNNNNVDVSIIVPMFRSKDHIEAQIKNWDMENDGLKKEIIYVDDSCPQNSAHYVLPSWEGLKNRWSSLFCNLDDMNIFKSLGKIVILSNNSGFATACNIGAKYAKGNYLVFLNADTIVTTNWVKPMISLLSDEIGMVGNLQLKFNGSVDSAGSQWDETNRNYLHIGRDIYKGKRLSEPISFHNLPEDLAIAGEREMVTGCCFAMRRNLFEQVGGFDIGYRIAYWEDSDLNEKVKAMGYKIFYQPESIIYHTSGHSNCNVHQYIAQNSQRFLDKWKK